MRHKIFGLYIISIINLLIMHYIILLSCRVEEALDAAFWIDNLFGAVFDVTIISAIALLFTWGRLRISLFITAIITLTWAYSNVLYSRFFHHYLSFSAISQAGTLVDSFMLRNVMEGIKWFDLFFVLLAIISFWLYYSTKKESITLKWKTLFVIWPTVLLLVDLFYHIVCCIVTPGQAYLSYYKHRLYVRHIELLHGSAEPNWACFHRGSVRQTIFPVLYQALTNTELTNEQRVAIEKEYLNNHERISDCTETVEGKNLIFIIVESYLSVTSDLLADGKEITPFLNSLKRDSNVYYNALVTPNISIGESSDGQFVYMTGLLPLRSEVTVTKAKYAELPGLPKLLKKEGIIKEAQMFIPTLPSMWEQEGMCEKYGFDQLYSSADYENGNYWYLSDKQIFEYAIEINHAARQPFLSVILTMSMHQPYTQPMDPSFIINNMSMTEKYRNYLSTCHYTDQQIKCYFEKLKEYGLYENSIIVIAADHHANANLFDMSENDIPTNIPLYIINGNIDNITGWQGECNQLDVYTTLLDIYGTNNPWHGLGHTLITDNYHNSVTPLRWLLSEQIVVGNFFKK